MRWWVCVCAVIIGAVSFAQDDTKTVVVVGKSALEGDAGWEDALRDAFRKAVEQGCGVFVTARSEVRDFKLVYDLVITEARGYVVGYKVMRRWHEGKIACVEVEATVSIAELKADWALLWRLLKERGDPTFLVAVVDRVDGEARKSDVAASRMIGVLLREKITCMNGKIAEEAILYLMARGLSEEEATSVIIRGFLNVDITGLPDALARETKKMLDMSLEKVM